MFGWRALNHMYRTECGHGAGMAEIACVSTCCDVLYMCCARTGVSYYVELELEPDACMLPG